MIGGLFAGLQESPGAQILFQGRTFKVYRAWVSLGAMVTAPAAVPFKRLHGDEEIGAEGVEGRAAVLNGTLGPFVYQLWRIAGGNGYLWNANHRRVAPRDARFIQVTSASVREKPPS